MKLGKLKMISDCVSKALASEFGAFLSFSINSAVVMFLVTRMVPGYVFLKCSR